MVFSFYTVSSKTAKKKIDKSDKYNPDYYKSFIKKHDVSPSCFCQLARLPGLEPGSNP